MAIKHCAFASLYCLLLLHAPNGGEIKIDSHHIVAMQPLPKGSEKAVAPGVRTIVHTGGQKFGVTESLDDIDNLLANCEGEQ